MNKSRHVLLFGALCSVFAAVLLTCCATKGDPIVAVEQVDKKAGIAAPGIAETKAIAEEDVGAVASRVPLGDRKWLLVDLGGLTHRVQPVPVTPETTAYTGLRENFDTTPADVHCRVRVEIGQLRVRQQDMIERVKEETIRLLFHIQIQREEQVQLRTGPLCRLYRGRGNVHGDQHPGDQWHRLPVRVLGGLRGGVPIGGIGGIVPGRTL